jgi:hypothetical protein
MKILIVLLWFVPAATLVSTAHKQRQAMLCHVSPDMVRCGQAWQTAGMRLRVGGHVEYRVPAGDKPRFRGSERVRR